MVFPQKRFNYIIQILKITPSPSPSLKNPKSMNMQILFISKLLDTRCLPEKSILSVCALGGLQFCDVTNHARRYTSLSEIFIEHRETFPPLAEECEKSLLVSNYTVKLQYSRE